VSDLRANRLSWLRTQPIPVEEDIATGFDHANAGTHGQRVDLLRVLHDPPPPADGWPTLCGLLVMAATAWVCPGCGRTVEGKAIVIAHRCPSRRDQWTEFVMVDEPEVQS
jgi:hypothetical protein